MLKAGAITAKQARWGVRVGIGLKLGGGGIELGLSAPQIVFAETNAERAGALGRAVNAMLILASVPGDYNFLGKLDEIAELSVAARGTRSGTAEIPNKGTGPLRDPARTLLEGEDVLADASDGLQSRTSSLFEEVTLGKHGDDATKYLWTIDERGINVIPEKTPFDTPRGHVVHTNLSQRASIGGEVWFESADTVIINAGSGRFGDGAGITREQWDAAICYWQGLGYKVKPIPYGSR